MFKDNSKLKIIFFLGFLLSLHLALTAYINSSFLASYIGEKWIGAIYILGSLSSIIALVTTPALFRKIGGYKFLLYTTLLSLLSLLVFSLVDESRVVIPAFVIYLALNTLIIFSLDEILKIFSPEVGTGKVRGLFLAITSTAWVLAQVASIKILDNFSFPAVYFITFLLMLGFVMIYYGSLRAIPDPKYDRENSVRAVKKFFKNKNLLRAYQLSFLIQFFYCWMVIYTPIYLHSHLGFSWAEISKIFSIMLLPFCFLPFQLGKYSDKIGERKMLMIGFTISALSTLSLFLIPDRGLWMWAFLLFLTRVGASTIEIMSDVYFFKHMRAENEEFVGVYRSAAPVAYALGPLLATITFTLVPSYNFIYIVLGTVLLYGIYVSSTIRRGDI